LVDEAMGAAAAAPSEFKLSAILEEADVRESSLQVYTVLSAEASAWMEV